MSGPYSWSFTTGAVAQCPCSIWQDGTPTGAADATDTNAMTLGVQFQAGSSGYITGVRFYKEADNTGTHTGSLWSSTGTLLASGTFTGETASGWQELDFSSPVAVTAGTTYVASYFTSAGHYAATQNGLASAVTNGPLTALAGGGVYAYGVGEHLPHQHLQGVELLGRRGLLALIGRHAVNGACLEAHHSRRGGAAAAAGLAACSDNSRAPTAAHGSHENASGCRSAAASSTTPGTTGRGRETFPTLDAVRSAATARDPHALSAGLNNPAGRPPAARPFARHPGLGPEQQPPLPLIQMREDRLELRRQHLLGDHHAAHTTPRARIQEATSYFPASPLARGT